MLTLVVTSGSLEGQRIDIGQELTIGREQADLELEDDDEVSRRHACLRPVADGLEIEDLGSTNGTRVNGLRITEAVVVGDGAMVKIGQTIMRVEVAGVPTRVRDAPDPRATKISTAPAGTEPRPVAPEPVAVPAAAAAPPARAAAPTPAGQFGTFRASDDKRQRGVASRFWLPAALTYAAIAGTAAGLIAYFA